MSAKSMIFRADFWGRGKCSTDTLMIAKYAQCNSESVHSTDYKKPN